MSTDLIDDPEIELTEADLLDAELDEMIDCWQLEDDLNNAVSVRDRLLRGEL